MFLNVVQQCLPRLHWRTAGVAALVVAGLILCLGLPSLTVLAGVALLLLIIACLVPCLIPLALMRGKQRNAGSVLVAEPAEQRLESDNAETTRL